MRQLKQRDNVLNFGANSNYHAFLMWGLILLGFYNSFFFCFVFN